MHERLRRNMLEGDKEYAARFINPELMGNLLGEGYRLRVYSLKDEFSLDQVHGTIFNPDTNDGINLMLPDEGMAIKIPRTNALLPPSTPDRKFKKMEICFDRFEPFVVRPTYLVEQGNTYCILQRKLINFERLNPVNIALVSDQIEELFARQQQAVRDGMSLDMLGKEGVGICLKALISKKILPEMANIVIEYTDNGPKLQIPDISIEEPRNVTQHKGFLKRNMPTSQAAWKRLNNHLIKHHYGLVYAEAKEK